MFIALMSALGNAMFVLSQTIFKTSQIALDLSHIGTFVAAVFGGPVVGLLTGLLVGIGPGLYFGYLGGSLGLLGLIGLPVGKALTGLTTGLLAKIIRSRSEDHLSMKMTGAALLGYLPESLFTAVYFESIVPILLPNVAAGFIFYFGSMNALVISILAKAWLEIAILAVFTGTLMGNTGFTAFMKQYFTMSTRLAISQEQHTKD